MFQRFVLTFGQPDLATEFQSVKAVRCPDCSYRFEAAVEYGSPAGLLDVESAQVRLLDHARRAATPHPTLLGHPTPVQRSA